jgi:uncharacterized protein (UPF0335 family)
MDVGGIAGGQLRAFVERYERLQEEIDEVNGDKGELMKEVESNGFDKKVFKIVVKRRRMGKDACDEEDSLVELYERALEGPPAEETSEEEASRAGARVHVHEAEPAAAAV